MGTGKESPSLEIWYYIILYWNERKATRARMSKGDYPVVSAA
jgi:hypothetical protein